MEFHYLNQLFYTDGFEDIFKDFDWNLLDQTDFKEDAVREEIIFPLLKQLGYSASSEHKIIRSKSLKHPFHYFGTKKYNINIIPDYTFNINGINCWILDAKRPTENIKEGKNVYQVYSYAIHPEIQCEIYCLCNGREFSIFSVQKHKLLLNFEIRNLKQHWRELKNILHPEFIKKPKLSQFCFDLGLVMLKISNSQAEMLVFELYNITYIGKIQHNLYAINHHFKIQGIENQIFLATFDFDEILYTQLLKILPQNIKITISNSLNSQPFSFKDDNALSSPVKITANIGKQIITNADESYLPFKVVKFEKGEY